jgi:hypothetical protein
MKITVDIPDAHFAAVLSVSLDPEAHLGNAARYAAQQVYERVEGDKLAAVGLPRTLRAQGLDDDQVAFLLSDAGAKKAAKDAEIAEFKRQEAIAAQAAADAAAAAAEELTPP